MEIILLNLNIISACFPLVKGSAPHSQSPYISPEIPITAVLWFAQTSLERQGQTSRSFSFGASFRTQWTCTAPPSCIAEGGHVLPLPTLLRGVQAAQLGIPDSAFFPPRCPWSCHLLPHWKSRIWPAGKIILDFSFPHSNGKREFCFSRSSFHIINELKQHLFSGTSHQKKQFSSSLKTNYKPWVFQGFCCLWNTKILAIAQCKLKADLDRGDEISLLIFLEQISKCIWMIRQTAVLPQWLAVFVALTSKSLARASINLCSVSAAAAFYPKIEIRLWKCIFNCQS